MKLNEFSVIGSSIRKTRKGIRLDEIAIMKVILMKPKDKINTNDKNNEDIILLNDEE